MSKAHVFYEETSFKKYIKNRRKKGYEVWAITGHRDLLESELIFIKEEINAFLSDLKDKEQNLKVVLLCALAPGADQLFYSEFIKSLGKNGELCLLEVFPQERLLEHVFYGSSQTSKVTDDINITPYEYYQDTLKKNEVIKFKIYEENTRESVKPTEMFELLGKILVDYSDRLIALWDGNYGSGVGGTGDVVKMWSRQKALIKKELNQLVVKRTTNKFPLKRTFFNTDSISSFCREPEWSNSIKPPLKRDGVKTPKILWIIFAIVLVYFVTLRIFWIASPISYIISVISLLAGLFVIVFLMDILNAYKSLIYRFITPIVLVLLTLGLGSYGFYELHDVRNESDSIDNCFFQAVGFISFGNSDFTKVEAQNLNYALLTARNLGVIAAIYTFLYAFLIASGIENIHKLRFYLFRILLKRKSLNKFIFLNKILTKYTFKVIIGNGEKPLALALNLVKSSTNKSKVVVLSDTVTYDQIKDTEVYLFKGKITEIDNLKKTYYQKAEEVYIMSDNDEDSFHVAEIAYRNIANPVKVDYFKNSKWYIHQNYVRNRELLPKLDMDEFTVFSLNENIIRRLIAKYPIDRFRSGMNYFKDGTVSVSIFGFNEFAEDILLYFIRIGHFEFNTHENKTKRTISLDIYHREEEEVRVNQFKKRYPSLFLYSSNIKYNTNLKGIQTYAFPNIETNFLNFHKLPMSEAELCDRNWNFYTKMNGGRVSSVFMCLSSGMENTSILSSVLPQLNYIRKEKNNDIQVFCQYDAKNKEELDSVEYRINALAPTIPIIYYSNEILECSEESIKNTNQDELAKRVAVLYDCLYDKDKQDKKEMKHEITKVITILRKKDNGLSNLDSWVKEKGDEIWQKKSQNHRASNRYAADHADVKLRMIHKNESAFDWFYKCVLTVWESPSENKSKEELNKEFFDLLETQDIPNLPEIEHRRWVACNLLDGFSQYPIESEEDIITWNKNKNQFKEQKVHKDLIPFEALDDESKDKDISGVCGII